MAACLLVSHELGTGRQCENSSQSTTWSRPSYLTPVYLSVTWVQEVISQMSAWWKLIDVCKFLLESLMRGEPKIISHSPSGSPYIYFINAIKRNWGLQELLKICCNN